MTQRRPGAAEHASAVLRVTELLRGALFDGEHPPGAPLREVALAESLAVSRSTVREALAVLAAEGLAVQVPNRGTFVRELDAAAVRDVCRAREVIETAGLRRWAEASGEARAAVRRALDDFEARLGSGCSAAEFTEAHLAVHRAIAALGGSERLTAAADALYAEVRLALAHLDRVRGNAHELVHSHTDLVDLIDAGHTDAAVAELHHHLLDAEESMVAAVS